MRLSLRRRGRVTPRGQGYGRLSSIKLSRVKRKTRFSLFKKKLQRSLLIPSHCTRTRTRTGTASQKFLKAVFLKYNGSIAVNDPHNSRGMLSNELTFRMYELLSIFYFLPRMDAKCFCNKKSPAIIGSYLAHSSVDCKMTSTLASRLMLWKKARD